MQKLIYCRTMGVPRGGAGGGECPPNNFEVEGKKEKKRKKRKKKREKRKKRGEKKEN